MQPYKILVVCVCMYMCMVRAQVYVSHGIAEHMGRYELLGRTLSENGILAEGHDHGKIVGFLY